MGRIPRFKEISHGELVLESQLVGLISKLDLLQVQIFSRNRVGSAQWVIPPRASQTQLPFPEGNLKLLKQLEFTLEHFGSSDGSNPGIPSRGMWIHT